MPNSKRNTANNNKNGHSTIFIFAKGSCLLAAFYYDKVEK
ncbi:hypothetical protein P7266_1090 [Lactococcus cremoris]|nr:hypothetical protein P7266_1090 [Lactococcus cremoris]